MASDDGSGIGVAAGDPGSGGAGGGSDTGAAAPAENGSDAGVSVRTEDASPEPTGDEVKSAMAEVIAERKGTKPEPTDQEDEDAGDEPGDDTTPAAETPDEGSDDATGEDSGDGESAAGEFETDAELDAALDEAMSLGMSDTMIVAAAQSGQLKAAIGRQRELAAQGRGETPEMPELGDLEVPDEIVREYGEELGGFLKQALPSFVGKAVDANLRAAMAPMQAELDRLRRREAAALARQEDQESEKFFLDNRERFGDRYGGPVDELDAESAQFRNRAEVVMKADVLRTGYRASGLPVPSWTTLLEEAAAMHTGASAASVPSEAKKAKPSGRSVSRPNRSTRVPSQDPRERAISKAEAALRKRGLS